MKVNRFFIILVLIIIVFPHISPACTTFCFKNNGDWIYGRNYDWHTGHCLVMVNKRGVSKVALRDHNPAKWVSKYGSITFNQYGREFPLGGMNEAGLVIECMWLNGSKYPPPDSRAALSELQWIQYQLDNYAAVEDVIKSDKIIRIDVSDSSPLHFLVCDRNGQAATIEFLDGKMKVHTKETLPASALTNHTYEDSILLWKIAGGNEGSEAVKRANYSLKRFFWAARGVDKWNREKRGSPVDYAFNVLGRAAVNRTMFRIVYDVKNSRIYFRTRANSAVRFLDFKKFDFACGTPVKVLNISSNRKGDVTAFFTGYSFKANHELIKKSFSETYFLRNEPKEDIRERARYPETLPCKK